MCVLFLYVVIRAPLKVSISWVDSLYKYYNYIGWLIVYHSKQLFDKGPFLQDTYWHLKMGQLCQIVKECVSLSLKKVKLASNSNGIIIWLVAERIHVLKYSSQTCKAVTMSLVNNLWPFNCIKYHNLQFWNGCILSSTYKFQQLISASGNLVVWACLSVALHTCA